jgi:MFS family permease
MSDSLSRRAIIHRLVALGFVVMALSTGVKSVYQVYFSDLASHFGRGRADFAWSGAVFMLTTGLASPLVGGLSDRLGPLRTVLVGVLVAGATLIVTSLYPGSLALFVLAYGVGAAFALAAMTYVPMGVLVDRLFDENNKGFAYAVVTNGAAIGFIVLSPMWVWLQPQFHWTTTFLVTGLVFSGPIALVVWWSARVAGADAVTRGRTGSTHGPGAWREVRRDPGFYVLALGFFGCGATMAFIDVHLVPFWQDSSTPRTQVGLSLSLLGVVELGSSLMTGWLAMRHDKHALLGLLYALRCTAMLMLTIDVPGIQTLGFAAVFGASYLGTVVVTSLYCFERYGAAVKGQVFGMLFLIHQLGAFASVQLGAWGYDALGSYRPAILALAALTVVAALASWFGLRGIGGGGRQAALRFAQRVEPHLSGQTNDRAAQKV